MKRAYALFLALLLILTGCAGKEKTNNVSVDDVCCPYEINHKKDMVEITLRDGKQSGILWRVETVPEDICQVTEVEVNKDDTCRYRLSGKEEGAAQLTFTALQTDETVCFVLTVVVNVDSKGKAVVSSYQHYERIDNFVDADGLKYKWNVDINGILHFSFINREDYWSVSGDGADIFVLSNMMSTPAGCKFSAQAKAAGQTTIVLASENTQRTIHVVIQADDNGEIEVVSVQEQ
jgi:hypothetical protein